MTSNLDLTRNKQLAMLARMSLTHARSQRLITNWLLRDFRDQAHADLAVTLLESCASVSNTDTNKVGDWDALAHGLMMVSVRHRNQWFLEESGFVNPGEDIFAVIREVFEERFVGKPYIFTFDLYGGAMITQAARI